MDQDIKKLLDLFNDKETDTDEEDEDREDMQEGDMLPVIAIRGLTAFPGAPLQVQVGRGMSVEAFETAMNSDKQMLALAQIDAGQDDVQIENLYTTGVILKISNFFPIGEGLLKVFCEGGDRVKATAIKEVGGCLMAEYAAFPVTISGSERIIKGSVERIKTQISQLSQERQGLSDGLLSMLNDTDEPERVLGIGTLLGVRKGSVRQAILEKGRLEDMLKATVKALDDELMLAKLEREISSKARENIDENQREYFLREEIHVIEEELGDDESSQAEEMLKKLAASKMNDDARAKVKREIERFRTSQKGSPEIAVSENYIRWMLDMPWGIETAGKIDIAKARKILDADHYGMKKVKERILEYLAVCQIRGDLKAPIICLVGPPGVGKTSIAKSIANALKRKYVRVALGGMHDEAEIRGHRRTYIASQPGRIAAGLKQVGACDPVFLFDEIDKLASDFRGDPASALLEALDPAQNNTFNDHYLDCPFDLSKVLFITTANSAEAIPAALMDRMEVIELSSYTEEEKLQIAKRHLVPRQLEEHGIAKTKLKISDKALTEIIRSYTREAGVRSLEREIGRICRKSAVKLLESGDEDFKLNVKPDNLEEFLGHIRFLPNDVEKEPMVGIINGLAWTSVGGTVMPIEVAVMPGTGKIELTGSLGDVMKESAHTAISYIRTMSLRLGIDEEFYKNKDIHIHVPEGAVPKDGPSAGVALCCAVVSALTGRKARQDVAMTGEITLRGHVFPIGGLKEKLLAAYRLGIKTLLIPYKNENDIQELPEDIRSELDIRLLHEADEAIGILMPGIFDEVKSC